MKDNKGYEQLALRLIRTGLKQRDSLFIDSDWFEYLCFLIGFNASYLRRVSKNL